MTHAVVRLDRVSKRFGTQQVLDEVTFEIPKGTAFVLLGRSGAGKSVALRHIIGLVKPDAGRVLVADRDIGALGSQELSDVRKHVGFLFQNAALFDSMTVGENVEFPLRRHTRLSGQEIRGRARQKLEYERGRSDRVQILRPGIFKPCMAVRITESR